MNDLDLALCSDLGSAIIPDLIDYLGNNFSANISGIDDGYSHAFQVGGGSSFGSGYTKVADEKNNVEAVFISAATLECRLHLSLKTSPSLPTTWWRHHE